MEEKPEIKNCVVKIEKLSQTGDRSRFDSFSGSDRSNESDSSTDSDTSSESGGDINTEEETSPNSSEEENDLPKTPGMEKEDMLQITSTEQYEIYLNLVEKDEIFGKRLSEQNNFNYTSEKWVELSKTLNSCEDGAKLPPNEWRARFNRWKSNIKAKCKMAVKSKHRINFSLSLLEKKAISLLWKLPEDQHVIDSYMKKALELAERKPDETEKEDMSTSDESEKETENKKISNEQYEIYFKAVKEDKLIGQRSRGHLDMVWEKLTELLNNCESGLKLPQKEWRKKFKCWKSYVMHKYRKAAKSKRKNMDLTLIEKKGIDFWRRYSVANHRTGPSKKKSLESSRHKPVVETEDTSGESEKETEPEYEEISTQQYEIYLKLLEEDKLFERVQQYSTRFKKKWEELRSLLNNCEYGPKLSRHEWGLRFNTWKRITMMKYEKAVNSGRRISLFLSPIETKAISLWNPSNNKLRSNEGRTMETSRHNRETRISTKISNRAHAMDLDRLHKKIIKTSHEQKEVFLKLVEEDKIFRTEILPKNDPKYIDKKYAELAKRLNNCKSGPKLSANGWQTRMKTWKNFMKKKYQQIIKNKPRDNFVLHPIEKKAISLWWRLPEKYLQETSRNVPKETNREDVTQMESEEITLKRKATDMENGVTTIRTGDIDKLSKEMKRWADIKEEKLKFQIAKFKFRNPGFAYDYVAQQDQPNLRL